MGSALAAIGAASFKVVASILLLLVFDTCLGLLWYTNTTPSARVLHNHSSKHTIVLLPGFQNKASALSNTLAWELNRSASVIMVDYPSRGFDVDKIYQLILDTMQEHNLKNPSFYGGSMGGQLAALIAERYTREGSRFGEVEVILMDCSPAQAEHIKAPAQLMRNAKWLSGGPLMTLGKSLLIRWQMQPSLNNVEAGVSIADVKHHYWAMGLNPMPSTAAQAQFMAGFHMEPDQLKDVGKVVIFIASVTPDEDSLIFGYQAYDVWDEIYGGHVEQIVDWNRKRTEHNPAAERPSLIGDIFVRELASLS